MHLDVCLCVWHGGGARRGGVHDASPWTEAARGHPHPHPRIGTQGGKDERRSRTAKQLRPNGTEARLDETKRHTRDVHGDDVDTTRGTEAFREDDGVGGAMHDHVTRNASFRT